MSTNDIKIIKEAVIRAREQIKEAAEIKIPSGAKIVFGKVIKDGKQIGVIKDKKFVAMKGDSGGAAKAADEIKAAIEKIATSDASPEHKKVAIQALQNQLK